MGESGIAEGSGSRLGMSQGTDTGNDFAVVCCAGDADEARGADPLLPHHLQVGAAVQHHGGAVRAIAEQRPQGLMGQLWRLWRASVSLRLWCSSMTAIKTALASDPCLRLSERHGAVLWAISAWQP